MKRLMMMLLLLALAIPASAFAAISGSGGGTSIADGKATLVSNNDKAYSYIGFDDLKNQPLTSLTELSADVVSGSGWGGGSPRFEVGVTDGSANKNIFVYLGDAPNFTSASAGPTGNLLYTDLRVDSTQIGGPYYGTWADAIAKGGSYKITGISLVVDSGWIAPQGQQFVFDAVSINRTSYDFAPKCTPTGFIRDGIDLTAAQVGGDVTGTLDATGCDIGVYYGPDTPAGKVDGATISNARYFGVVNDGGNVDVKHSTISNIGNSPFDGTQHGVGIFYTTEHDAGTPKVGARASGTISDNILPSYQKGGITVRGAKASADILNNILTGSGQVSYIAQNGIQVSFGATGLVKGNTVTDNWYTPTSNTACGLLLYQAGGVKQQANNLSNNETNLCNVGRGGGNATP